MDIHSRCSSKLSDEMCITEIRKTKASILLVTMRKSELNFSNCFPRTYNADMLEKQIIVIINTIEVLKLNKSYPSTKSIILYAEDDTRYIEKKHKMTSPVSNRKDPLVEIYCLKKSMAASDR